MTIKVLKSKGSGIKVTEGNIDLFGTIKLPKEIMESLNIAQHEKVTVYSPKVERNFFVEESKDNAVVVPFGFGGVGGYITVVSTLTTTVDEPFKEPIILDFKSNEYSYALGSNNTVKSK